MILDARQPATPDRLEGAVAIVGSGAAGLTLALELDAAGIATVLVEAGGDAVDAAAQDFYRAAVIEPESHGPVHLYRRRAFGGTTAIWGGRCIPFDPIDFEERPWIAHSGWPIGHAEVAAYYPRALARCDAGSPAFTAEAALPGEQGPIVEGEVGSDLILDRIERFSNPLHFGRRYRAQVAASRHVTVLQHAGVTQITASEGGRAATGLVARTRDGRTLTVVAPHVVVAAGGLETPRLLLASRDAVPTGLGNGRDLVGRFYQAHIEGEVGEIRFARPPREVALDYAVAPDGAYCRRYLWLSPDAQRRERTGGLVARPHHPQIVDPAHRDPVLSAMYLVKNLILPEYGRKMTSTEHAAKARYAGGPTALYAAHVRNVAFGAPKLAAFSWKWVRKRNLAARKLPSVVQRDSRNLYALDINAEQTPNPDSRVTLGDEVDAFGMPRLAIRWRTVEEDRAMIARGLRAMQHALAGSGAAAIAFDDARFAEEVAATTRIGGHHIGTARMASAPDRGVVDGNGEVFGTRGLYVAGAAVFPTSGFANPTLTVVALAIRLGKHLKAVVR